MGQNNCYENQWTTKVLKTQAERPVYIRQWAIDDWPNGHIARQINQNGFEWSHTTIGQNTIDKIV
jgi:hypothetical protein